MHTLVFIIVFTSGGWLCVENDCHRLDLANHIQGSGTGPSYDKYAAALGRQTELKDERKSIRGDLRLLEQLLTHHLTSAGVSTGVIATTNPRLLDLVTEIQTAKGQLQNIVICTYNYY